MYNIAHMIIVNSFIDGLSIQDLALVNHFDSDFNTVTRISRLIIIYD